MKSLLTNPVEIPRGEYWRIVKSKPWFMASSLGRIMLVPVVGKTRSNGIRQYGGVPRTGSWVEKEKRFNLVHRGKTYKVARLVCEAFFGIPPKGKNVCMHLDENSRNNRPSNLKWGTQKDNLNADGFIKYCKSRLGENSPATKGMKNRK